MPSYQKRDGLTAESAKDNKGYQCLKTSPDPHAVGMPSTNKQWSQASELTQMFSVLTPSEGVQNSPYLTKTNGYHKTSSGNNNNPLYRPIGLPQFLKVSAAKVFRGCMSPDKNTKLTQYNPSTLTFLFVNGYVFPLDARPIIEFTSSTESESESIVTSDNKTRILYVDLPYLVNQWNIREIQFRTTGAYQYKVMTIPSFQHYMSGTKVWLNPVNKSSSLTFETGGGNQQDALDIPVERHYNFSVTRGNGINTVNGGYKICYQFLSVTKSSDLGAWVTFSHPFEGTSG
jgi:hypothetical protein